MNAKILRKIRIFAASPSDVDAERAKLGVVIGMLKPMADHLGVTLEVVDWRDVVPDTGRPQQVIFEQLRPTSWDVFVGILWHRFGTPTGAADPQTQKDYLSGTEEEFRVAYHLREQFDKPRILMYSCARPIPHDADFTQAQKVKDFFREIQNPKSRFRVLTQSFDTTKAFEKLLLDHLQKLLIEYSEQETKGTLTRRQVQALVPRVPDNLPPRVSFFGRNREIKTTIDALSPIERGWGVIIDGIGGIGKTALAVEVAHRCKEMGVFDAFVFITAKQRHLGPAGIEAGPPNGVTTLDGFMNETAQVLARPGIAELAGQDKRRTLLGTLRETRALLIFDNVETLSKKEQEVLTDWLRFLPKDCKAILTGRRHVGGGGGAFCLRLEKLDWDDAKAIIRDEYDRDGFLAHIFKDTKEIHWREIYDATGGSPLALKWTLGSMSMRSLSLNRALSMLRQESKQVSELKKFIYEEALREIGTNGKFALFGLSFFAPSATFDALLAVTNLPRFELQAILERLDALSLVDLLPGEERYSMHPLTRAYIHHDLHKDPKIMREVSLRFVRYWLDYSTRYGSSIKTYDRLESEWMNLTAAYTQVKRIAAVTADAIGNKEIARFGISLISSLHQFLLFSRRWDEGIDMDAFGYDVARILNVPFLRTFTVESSDERADISMTPKIGGKVVSQSISPSSDAKKPQISDSPTQTDRGMRAVDIIVRKRDGLELTSEEIRFFINGVSTGVIPDYQAASWIMAAFFRGMTVRESTDLTLAMAQSGGTLDLSDIGHPVVDLHSTGGVGDKTTLAVLPAVAACGLPIGKMSGRGLGYTGRTLDKMESITGFRVNLSSEEYRQQLLEIGVVLTGQTLDLAPVDGRLYALRDVTGSVPSIPLIASSILSKKIAAGAQAILIDVKVGSGAFMPSVAEATRLAKVMIGIGRIAQRKVAAVISDMNQPLGHAVGNALEVREAIDTLQGVGPLDFREHCLEVGARLLVLTGKAKSLTAAKRRLETALADGSGLAKFRQLVEAQGGDVRVVDDPERLPKAAFVQIAPAPRSGYLSEVDAREVGLSAVALGAGRARKGDMINHAVGLVILHKVGDEITKDEPLFVIHADDASSLEQARQRVLAAHKFSFKKVSPLPLFYRVIKSR